MRFFEDFTLISQNTQYKVRYKGETLLAISKKGLNFLLSDKIVNREEVEPKDIRIDFDRNSRVKALKLVKVYADAKRAYYPERNIKYELKVTDKDFQFFEKAVEIIERHKTTNTVYIEAQIQGLSFIDNGKGVFPKPSQLATNAAEDRILNYLEESDKSKLVEIAISNYDKDTPLSENKAFNAYSKKILEKTATYKEALFVQKLLKFKKRKPSKKVEEYVAGFN